MRDTHVQWLRHTSLLGRTVLCTLWDVRKNKNHPTPSVSLKYIQLLDNSTTLTLCISVLFDASRKLFTCIQDGKQSRWTFDWKTISVAVVVRICISSLRCVPSNRFRRIARFNYLFHELVVVQRWRRDKENGTARSVKNLTSDWTWTFSQVIFLDRRLRDVIVVFRVQRGPHCHACLWRHAASALFFKNKKVKQQASGKNKRKHVGSHIGNLRKLPAASRNNYSWNTVSGQEKQKKGEFYDRKDTACLPIKVLCSICQNIEFFQWNDNSGKIVKAKLTNFTIDWLDLLECSAQCAMLKPRGLQTTDKSGPQNRFIQPA